MADRPRFACRVAIASFAADTGIATVTLKMPGRVNKLDLTFGEDFSLALDWVLQRSALRGIVLASGHKNFCVGADLEWLYQERNPQALLAHVQALQRLYRRLETSGVPVAAALTGSAIAGGFELALACHHRVALDSPNLRIGLPEVSLGLVPGLGGTQRLSRLLGLERALAQVLGGQVVAAREAHAAGLVDELVSDAEAVLVSATAWVRGHSQARQPWDDPNCPAPGPAPNSQAARDLFMATCAAVLKRTAGARNAEKVAVQVIYEGAGLQFDRALEVEARSFVALAASNQCKDMMRTVWFHRSAANKQRDLPQVDDAGIRRIAVLGAGMMGSAIAFVCAKNGYQVTLRDTNPQAFEKARERWQTICARGQLDEQSVLSRIQPTLDLGAVEPVDLVIETVPEDFGLKQMMIAEAERTLCGDAGIWASNSSALPISQLATVAKNPNRIIGLHFFSPAEKMPLVEIIKGARTDESTVACCLAFCRALGKTAIVVRDGYGFYTTRVFSAYVSEGAELVAEGYPPALVEWAARTAGMAVGPLQVFDEVSLSLGLQTIEQAERWTGRRVETGGVQLVRQMVHVLGRQGRASGAGFYDYEGGRRVGLWPGLATLAARQHQSENVAKLGQRLLLRQAVEAVRALEEGVLERKRDAEVGATLGLGFAPHTGGPLSYLDRLGIGRAVGRLRTLAASYGERFQAPQLLKDMRRKGETFFEPV